jgi:hypothetical protein
VLHGHELSQEFTPHTVGTGSAECCWVFWWLLLSCVSSVCRPGISGVPGEQLLQSPPGPQHSHMLHTQQSVQQRNSIPSFSRDSLHVRDRDVHSQQPQQQQQHSCEGSSSASGSPHKGAVSKGSGRFKRRGVVADVCWMLRIKTFQVGGQP